MYFIMVSYVASVAVAHGLLSVVSILCRPKSTKYISDKLIVNFGVNSEDYHYEYKNITHPI